MAEDNLTVKLEIKSPKLKSRFEKILRSVKGFNIQGPTAKGLSNLLIFELGDKVDQEFQFV